MEALPDAKLHGQVCHCPAGVVPDEVCQVLQHVHVQDLHRALIEGWQLGGILLEVHQGVCLRLQLEEPATRRGHSGESWGTEPGPAQQCLA